METKFIRGDSVAIIYMKDGENRMNHTFLEKFNKALDQVERNPNVKILITTGNGRFYSNGVDLNYFGEHPEELEPFRKAFFSTLCRLLTFPVVTVAAINGHAFAGGGILAFAHDLRVMRKGQGWVCLNEILLKIVIPIPVLELVRSKITSGPAMHALFVFGKRFSAEDALSCRFVDRICQADSVLSEAINLGVETCGKQEFDRETLGQMKTAVYKCPVELLNEHGNVKSQL